MANEGGEYLILGVDDKTHKVVGTKVFENSINKLSNELFIKLKIRIDVEEIFHPNGRVVVFIIPGHQCGQPVKSRGRYFMRAGESLTEMDHQTLKHILIETEPSDFLQQ